MLVRVSGRFGANLQIRAYVGYTAYFALILFEFWVVIKHVAPQQMPPAPYASGSFYEVLYMLQQFGDIKFDGLYVCHVAVSSCLHCLVADQCDEQ